MLTCVVSPLSVNLSSLLPDEALPRWWWFVWSAVTEGRSSEGLCHSKGLCLFPKQMWGDLNTTELREL